MSPELQARRRRVAIRAAGAGIVWSVGLLLTALLTPLYNGQTSADANGLTLTTATYVQRNGAWVLIPLALPLIAGVGVMLAVVRPESRLRRAARVATIAVAVLGLVLVTSGGIVLLPVAILLGAALGLTRPLPPATHPAGGPPSISGAASEAGPGPRRVWSRRRRSAPGAES